MNTGMQPRSTVLRKALALLVPAREPGEVVVVHHFTDTKDHLQLEVERRSPTGIVFERIML